MIISVDTEITFDKTQHLVINKMGIEGTFYQYSQNHLPQATQQILFSVGEKLNTFFLISGTRQGCPI